MTERLADITARIDGVRQLGAVVNAMKGIAAARAHMARTQVMAVDSYAATIAAAMSNVLGTGPALPAHPYETGGKTGLLVFGAEQGFAGAFSERVLDSIGQDPVTLFLIGTRGLSVATARGLSPDWTAPLPSHPPASPNWPTRSPRRSITPWRQHRSTALRWSSPAGTLGVPALSASGCFRLIWPTCPPPQVTAP